MATNFCTVDVRVATASRSCLRVAEGGAADAGTDGGAPRPDERPLAAARPRACVRPDLPPRAMKFTVCFPVNDETVRPGMNPATMRIDFGKPVVILPDTHPAIMGNDFGKLAVIFTGYSSGYNED